MKHASFGLLGFFLALVAFGGCTSTKDNAASDRICEPGKEYHCQCVNKDEGTHVCADDGKSFEACLPCYGDEVIGDDDPPYVYDYDAATEYPDDTGVSEAGADAGASCGNGVVETGEQCDDKNLKANDGCSTTCTVEGKAGGVACPGLPVHVWSTAVTFDSTTVGYPNTHEISPTCKTGTGYGAGDRSFAVTAHKSGTLTVTTSKGTFPPLVYYSTKACSETKPMAYDACAYDAAKMDQTLSFAVSAGATYLVVVDTSFAKQGTFTISFEIK